VEFSVSRFRIVFSGIQQSIESGAENRNFMFLRHYSVSFGFPIKSISVLKKAAETTGAAAGC
jgi:hypothetical protein